MVYEIYKNLGLKVIIKINDRSLLTKYDTKILSSIDKLNKIGDKGVIAELKERGYSNAEETLSEIKGIKTSENLIEIESYYTKMGYPDNSLKFDPTLVRGLDYYTGLIFEVVLEKDENSSSLCGGGRWDEMIGKFTGLDLPAVGFAIGVDRTIEAMEEEGVLDVSKTETQVLVTIFNPELMDNSLEVTLQLRSVNIPSEIYLDPNSKLDRQLKYADQKGIPYVVIIGPDEAEKDMVTVKNLSDKSQETIPFSQLINKLK